MKLSQKQIDLIEQRIKEKYINKTKHPELDLYILNYSHSAQYDSVWDDATMMCRGLIVDSDYNVIARPFSKFFNLEQHQPEEIPNEPFEVYMKMDGSLGVLYFVEGKPFIATRGAFFSDQAVKANEIFQRKYGNYQFSEDEKKITYLFEIIYKENRIVVDYGDMEDLVLLAMIVTETGVELNVDSFKDIFPWPVVKKYDGINDLSKLKEIQNDNEEGFVIKFQSDFRVKVKFNEYVRLHRILTNVSSKNIWESLMKKDSLEDLLSRVPDEFYKWVHKVKDELEAKYKEIEAEALEFKKQVDELILYKDFKTARKIAAAKIMTEKKHLSSVIFKMLDEQDYSEIIWRMLKPEYSKPFKIDNEG